MPETPLTPRETAFLAAASMLDTADELRGNSNGDCNVIMQALMWETRAEALLAKAKDRTNG